MIAVWNGGPRLELFEMKPNRNVYVIIRNALRGGFATPISERYTNLSVTLTKLKQAGITVLIDDEAVLKKLPRTWRGSNFDILGPMVFVGDLGNNFGSLTDKQLQVLRDQFERLSIAS